MRGRPRRPQLGLSMGGAGGAHRLVGAAWTVRNGDARCLDGTERTQETVASSLTRGWRTVEMPVASARQRRLWWRPLPGRVSGEEGDRDSFLRDSIGRVRGAHCMDRAGLDQESASVMMQHMVEAPTAWTGWWGRRGPRPCLRRGDGARQRCPLAWRDWGSVSRRSRPHPAWWCGLRWRHALPVQLP